MTLEAEHLDWQPWQSGERESFFDAIDRHRRASWRVTWVCAFAIGALTLVLALLLAPLLVCFIGLLVDLVNLVVPMPDLLGAAGNVLTMLTDAEHIDGGLLFTALLVASVPGLLVMSIAVFALHRALHRSPLFDAGTLVGRAPDRSAIAEQRLVNIVEEMSIAAGIPVPHVLIIPGGVNAAVFGRDESHTTILIGEGILTRLNRNQTQGAVACLIGSVAGGDMRIGLRVALTFTLFGLMARLTSCFGDRREIYHVGRLFRSLMLPTRAGIERLMRELADPFAPSAYDAETPPTQPSQQQAQRPGDSDDSTLTWREWAMMPLVGPVVMSGFVSGIVCTFLLRPLVAFAWRKRKYMADAAAMRLTRDADALANALQVITTHGNAGLDSWASHMAIAPTAATPNHNSTLLESDIVSIFPSNARRLKALGRLGASVAVAAPAQFAMPSPMAVLIGALVAAAGALMVPVVVLLVWLSIALSGLFTILPAALLHALLRGVAE